jgi:hypothetical protein
MYSQEQEQVPLVLALEPNNWKHQSGNLPMRPWQYQRQSSLEREMQQWRFEFGQPCTSPERGPQAQQPAAMGSKAH